MMAVMMVLFTESVLQGCARTLQEQVTCKEHVSEDIRVKCVCYRCSSKQLFLGKR